MTIINESPSLRIGVSACLAGESVRYDGGHQRHSFVVGLMGQQNSEVLTLCPESGAGLGTPRETIDLVGEACGPRVIATHTRRDVTDVLDEWNKKTIHDLQAEPLDGYIFKARSPSCGYHAVPLLDNEGQKISEKGRGTFAVALACEFPLMPVVEEGDLEQPAARFLFLWAASAYQMWRSRSPKDEAETFLRSFHQRHRSFLFALNFESALELDKICLQNKLSDADLDAYGEFFFGLIHFALRAQPLVALKESGVE